MGGLPSRRLCLLAVLAAGILRLGGLPARAAETPPGTYRYTVTHPTFGTIGTFTNTITRKGDRIIVDTDLEVAVKVLVVTLRRVEAVRREVWTRGRLTGYRSVTRRGGRLLIVNGYADGKDFVIDGVDGRVTAPASVYPGNPWSIAILRADPIMGPETGRLYEVTFKDDGEETITVGGKAVRARHYTASGERHAELWYDRDGIPVKFSIIDEGSLITCTLASVSPPGAARHP